MDIILALSYAKFKIKSHKHLANSVRQDWQAYNKQQPELCHYYVSGQIHQRILGWSSWSKVLHLVQWGLLKESRSLRGKKWLPTTNTWGETHSLFIWFDLVLIQCFYHLRRKSCDKVSVYNKLLSLDLPPSVFYLYNILNSKIIYVTGPEIQVQSRSALWSSNEKKERKPAWDL